jgi:hypothetical protein
MNDQVDMEQYTGDTYSSHLLEMMRLIDIKSIEVRQAYIYGRDNREAHYQLISLLVQAWYELLPKVANNPKLAESFRKWKNVYRDPKILLIPRYESLIWQFAIHIRMAYEHLGLTNI